MITEMINRDKNHPSVIAWSLANEPLIKGDASFEYFSLIYSILFVLIVIMVGIMD
ncbi:unnamed protein product [Meloidogyne enterolobii]|uniref:Uncharacterized protein n=1 Tax=Meloidogyne enterolobii TaxID=390850 RepID=A0ACB1APD8_MELEN